MLILYLNIFEKEYLGFIIAIGNAVKGRKLTDEVKVNLQLLTTKQDKIDIFPRWRCLSVARGCSTYYRGCRARLRSFHPRRYRQGDWSLLSTSEKNCPSGMEILPTVTGLPLLKVKGSSSWLRCLQALGKKGGCFWLPIKAAL